MQKTSEGSISLAPGDRGAVKAPTAVGMGEDHHEQIELSRLIDIVNERFGTEFKPADQLFFDQIREEAIADTHIQQAAMRMQRLSRESMALSPTCRNSSRRFIARRDNRW